MTSIPMIGPMSDRDDAAEAFAPPPLIVQILGQLFFGIFAIVATVMAFDAFWLAGLALAIVIAVHGFGRRSEWRFARKAKAGSKVKVHVEMGTPASSGNASFDAYRADVLKRLEDEQKTFVSFLDRLRDAKDKSEFDAFINERARPSVPVTEVLSGSDSPRNGEY